MAKINPVLAREWQRADRDLVVACKDGRRGCKIRLTRTIRLSVVTIIIPDLHTCNSIGVVSGVPYPRFDKDPVSDVNLGHCHDSMSAFVWRAWIVANRRSGRFSSQQPIRSSSSPLDLAGENHVPRLRFVGLGDGSKIEDSLLSPATCLFPILVQYLVVGSIAD